MPSKRLSKSQFVTTLAEKSGLNKEPMTYKAKAAHRVIRVRALKALKDAI